MRYGKVSIFGPGLIGGAAGIDLVNARLAREVVGWGRNPSRLREALEAGACDSTTTDIEEAVNDSEILLITAPPGAIISIIKDAGPFLSEGMLIIDAGSVKKPIVEAASGSGLFEKGAEFVGCHPMAGSEKAGVRNSRPGMFRGSACIITPSENNTVPMVEKAAGFWRSLGAETLETDPEQHDYLMGLISHLPHAAAAAMVLCAFNEISDSNLIARAAGPSFQGMTRVALSGPELWADIFLSNRDNVLRSLSAMQDSLSEFKETLKTGDRSRLEGYLSKARERRKLL